MLYIIKKFNSYKFAFVFWIVGIVLFGQFYGIMAGVIGLFIDHTINNKRLWKKERSAFSTSIIWYAGVVPFSMFYTWIVVAATGPGVSNGIIYSFIEATAFFTDEMAKYFPVIDNYTTQILDRGDDWRVARVRHLYAVIWSICVITAPLLFKDVFRTARFMKNETIYKMNNKKRKWVFVIVLYLSGSTLLVICVLASYFFFKWGIYGNEYSTGGSSGTYIRLERYLSPSILGVFMFPHLFLVCVVDFTMLHYHYYIKPMMKFLKKTRCQEI